MYFKKFPELVYAFEFSEGIRLKVVRDITFNMRPIKGLLDSIVYYEDYDVQSGDTPEIIAEKLYKDPNLHWINMLANEKYHYLNDWPINESRFDQFMDAKYGVGHSYDIHVIYGRNHYVSQQGHIVDGNYPFAIPVTNIDYELSLNDRARRIKVVSPKVVDLFIKDLNTALGSNKL